MEKENVIHVNKSTPNAFNVVILMCVPIALIISML
jgi:hypothetical protein